MKGALTWAAALPTLDDVWSGREKAEQFSESFFDTKVLERTGRFFFSDGSSLEPSAGLFTPPTKSNRNSRITMSSIFIFFSKVKYLAEGDTHLQCILWSSCSTERRRSECSACLESLKLPCLLHPTKLGCLASLLQSEMPKETFLKSDFACKISM